MSNTETYDLFMDALEVVNRALDANRGDGVYGKVVEALDKHADGRTSAVEVYREDPSAPFDAFTIRYADGRFELSERGKGEHDTRWKVSTEYLESLVDDPETYVQHPARLDLDWLADRLPDEVATRLS